MEAKAEEYALFGIRGDGKTIGILGAILAHAEKHRRAGFGLPVPWMAVRDSFANHKVTTIKSLQKPLWKGKWQLYDSNHLAAFKQGAGKDDLVVLMLAGCDNFDSLNKLRQEAVGVWVQEAAPVEESGGVSDTAYGICNSSKGRVATYHSPTLLDLNYPDEDHWTWMRFEKEPQPGTMSFRIPPRENKHVPASYWEKMEQALASRPDLKRRLLDGMPGSIMRGPQVAVGFNENLHVSPVRLRPIKGEPLCFGQDGGHTPATTIGQAWRGSIRVYASIPMERGGMRQQYEFNVLPWLRANAPWAIENSPKKNPMIHGVYDPSLPDDESDSDRNPLDVIMELVGGTWEPGPSKWAARKGPLLTSMNLHVSAGTPALQLDPVGCVQLKQALSTRWHYPQNSLGESSGDEPKKPNHPWEDLGDAYIMFLCAAMPDLKARPYAAPVIKTAFDPLEPMREPRQTRIRSEFDPLR